MPLYNTFLANYYPLVKFEILSVLEKFTPIPLFCRSSPREEAQKEKLCNTISIAQKRQILL
jgi:hypothetical protein